MIARDMRRPQRPHGSSWWDAQAAQPLHRWRLDRLHTLSCSASSPPLPGRRSCAARTKILTARASPTEAPPSLHSMRPAPAARSARRHKRRRQQQGCRSGQCAIGALRSGNDASCQHTSRLLKAGGDQCRPVHPRASTAVARPW
eukprot:2381667-Prymnesium_polylepis.2